MCAGLRDANGDETTDSGVALLTVRVWENDDCSGTALWSVVTVMAVLTMVLGQDRATIKLRNNGT